MANRSFLVATTTRNVFPQLRQRQEKVEIIACGDWCVPILWFALFRREDMIRWAHHDPGLPDELAAPVAARRETPKRLAAAMPLLQRAAPKAGTWDVHLRLLGEAIDALDRKWKYVTCEWEEILAVSDPKGFYSGADWLLRFFSGERVQKACEGISKISGLSLHRALRDPVANSDGPWLDRDDKTLARLLGNEWKKSVPWWPKPVAPKIRPPDWHKLISRKDLAGVKRALAAGTPVPGYPVALAAHHSSEILEFLLSRGGDPNGASPLDGSAILIAFNYGGRAASRRVRLLLDAGADVNFHGLNHDCPFVLHACLHHGMEFAGRVLAKANAKSLKQFTAWTASDDYRRCVEEERLTWAKRFVALAKRELAKRS